jgi:outer membrane lipoprotein-sorting protein
MNRISASLVASAALAAGLICAGAGAQPQRALPSIEEVLSAPTKVSYSAVVESVRIGSHGSQASVYRVEHRAPDLTRRTYSAPPQLFGSSEIVEGNLKFLIDPRRHRIVETRDDATLQGRRALDANAALVRANYRAVRAGSELFDGRPTVDVLLVNKHTNRATMFVRIDRESNIVLDRQEFGADGAMLGETRLEQVRYTVAPQADFALPKGFALEDQRPPQIFHDLDRLFRNAGFAARRPPLPEGFVALDGDLVDLRGARSVQLLYSDGLRSVSLFESAAAIEPDMTPFHPESVKLGSRDAQYGEDGSDALLAWSDGTIYYTLVGELGRSDLRRLAAAITP